MSLLIIQAVISNYSVCLYVHANKHHCTRSNFRMHIKKWIVTWQKNVSPALYLSSLSWHFFLVYLNNTSHLAHLTVEHLLVDCCFRPITSLFLHLAVLFCARLLVWPARPTQNIKKREHIKQWSKTCMNLLIMYGWLSRSKD